MSSGSRAGAQSGAAVSGQKAKAGQNGAMKDGDGEADVGAAAAGTIKAGAMETMDGE